VVLDVSVREEEEYDVFCVKECLKKNSKKEFLLEEVLELQNGTIFDVQGVN